MKKLLLMFMISLFLVSIVNGQLEQTDKFETTPEPDTIDRRLSFFEKMFSYITPGAIIVSEPSGQIRDCDNFPTGGLHIFLKKYPQTKVIAVGVKCSENSLVRVYECKDGQSCNNLLKVVEVYKIGGVNQDLRNGTQIIILLINVMIVMVEQHLQHIVVMVVMLFQMETLLLLVLQIKNVG